MKKLNYLILMFSIVFLAVSCDEVPENSDANLLEIYFEGQIGISETDFISPELTCKIFGSDFSNVKITKMIISENATSSVKVGDALDFNNENSSATITITSETGVEKTYTVFAEQFGVPAFVGNWTFNSECYFNYTYCDDQGQNCGQDYYGNLSTDGYGTYFINGDPIYDNTLNIAYTTMDDQGFLNGTYTYGPGADGEMGSYEHETDGGNTMDLNDNFERLFPGNGTWKWNTVTNQITFYNADKSKQSVTYNNNGDKTHWYSADPNSLTLWLTVDRTGLPTDHEAFLEYGYTPTAWTLAGYVLTFNMGKN